MTLPASAPGDAQWGIPVPTGSGEPRASRGLPGGRVVALATLVVVVTAVIEALARDRIGLWTDVALVSVSVVAASVTRRGDRSLPAMMPPLAFLAAALIAGQLLLPDSNASLRTREGLMLLDVLGSNAAWVVAATVLSVTITLVRHLVDRHRDRRAARDERRQVDNPA